MSRTLAKSLAEPDRPVSQPKSGVNLRIEANTRRLIDEAAEILGKTRTEFMVDRARSRAMDVVLDQRLFALDPDIFDAFALAPDHPAEPGPRLRALLRRSTPWKG